MRQKTENSAVIAASFISLLGRRIAYRQSTSWCDKADYLPTQEPTLNDQESLSAVLDTSNNGKAG